VIGRLQAKREGVRESSAASGDPQKPIPASFWMAVFVFLFVSRATEWIPGLYNLPIPRLAFLVAIIVAYRNREVLSKVLISNMPIVRSALWLMALAVFSVFFSIYKSNTLKFVPGPIIIFLTIILLQKVTPAFVDLKRILVAMVLGSASLVIPTLLSYQGGRADVGSKHISLDTNDLAYVLVTILPLTLALRAHATGVVKLVYTGMAATVVATIFLTGSRGGMIALSIVAILIALKPIGIQKDGGLKKARVGTVLARFGALIALAGVVWVALPSDVKDRVSTLADLGSDYNASLTDNSSRLVIWTRSSKAVFTRPTGFGLGSMPAVDGMLGGLYKAAHNTLVQCFVELGFVGLFLLLRCYYLAWNRLGLIERSEKYALSDSVGNGQMPLLSRALRIGLVGNFVAAFFLSQAFSALLWTTIGVCAVMMTLAQVHTPTPEAKQRLRSRTLPTISRHDSTASRGQK
jgi:hypothetical protein